MNGKKLRLVSALFGALSLLFIVLLRTVDVAAVGPCGTAVGFSHLNLAFWQSVGTDLFWYKLTNALGYGAIALAAFFGAAGLLQWIRRGSLRKVDPDYWLLGGLYVLTGILYVVFEFLIVNYRPVILPPDTLPEASFPSSHTLLALIVFGSAALLSKNKIRRRCVRVTVQTVLWALAAVAVAGRLLSGVHWLTDVVGAVLFAVALVTLWQSLRRE